MSNSNWLFIILLIIVIALGGGWYLAHRAPVPITQVPDAATTPPAGGSTTPQATYKNADSNTIQVTAPMPGAVASSTFIVSGRARGTWYFEASFPLEVVSATGTQLVQMPIPAQGDWMTTEFVPFSATTTLPKWYHGPATLILHNDNPSGLPENEKSVSIPISIQ